MKKAKTALIIWSLGLVATLAACGRGGNTPSASSPDSKDSGSTEASSQASDSDSDSGTGTSEGSSAETPAANTGISSLIGASAAERTSILGALEKYAVDNMITGMPLFENGGYAMYNPRVVKGTDHYISGYGFGILREGSLTGPLTSPEVVKPDYYNQADTSDPLTINALNDKGTQVSGLFDNIASSYFGTKMNAAQDGYDWYGVLSTKDRPYIVKNGVASYPVDPEETSSTWRVYVRTGQEGGVFFHTNSEIPNRKAFDGRPVELQDYVDAFKILLCKRFGFYRGTELAKAKGYSSIVGASTYNAGTAQGIDDDLFESTVGVKPGHDDVDGDYIDFTLGAPANRFYAMYALASSLYSPINREFFNLVTNNGSEAKTYGSFAEDLSSTPVDNILSAGTYTLESWEKEVGIAFKRNDDWFERVANPQLYSIPGIYVNIFTAGKEDSNFVFQQFLNGRIDAAGIPLDYIPDYKNDPRTTTTKGNSVFKLNINSCTQDQWNALFGDEGTVARLGDNAYECKPWMSNENFIRGMFFSIDRDSYGAKRGRTPSINYFSSNYLSDPENGISYNATEEHENALADFWGDTVETGGYSEALSKASFNEAIEEMIANGTVKNNDTLSIDCWWMENADIKDLGIEIEEYVEKAFNNSSKAVEHNLKLDFVNNACDVWIDVYDKHLQIGKFDLGFGSISGNALDPLNFMEVLKSSNSSGFTLNWGKDTSALDLEYDGKTWSYDTLWGAVDHGVVTYKGTEVSAGQLSDVYAAWQDNQLLIDFAFADHKKLLEDIGDVDAEYLLSIPEEEWSMEVVEIDILFSAGNGAIIVDPSGIYLASFYANADGDYQYYQEFYGYDPEVETFTYATYFDNYEYVERLDAGWFESLWAEELEDGRLGYSLYSDSPIAEVLASTKSLAIQVIVAQQINGVESEIAVSLNIPIENAPTPNVGA